MSKKKCVIVGVGARGVASYLAPIATGHLSDVCEMCGLYDSVRARSEVASKEYGVPVFDDFDTMLDTTRPDFVIVTTMDSNHHEYVIRALDKGYDVVTEKPMTNTREKALAIMEAEKRSGHTARTTFNMRYSKPIEDLKRVIDSGVIGKVTHVDFTWLLDRSHGADYFRRWHRYMENTTSLLIHKSTHHFDAVNWIIEKKPVSVFARCTLEFYGKNGPYRGKNCRTCEHAKECPLYFDMEGLDFYQRYYVDVEEESGYLRDGCVFAEDIDIYDRMALSVLYEDGVTMNYSLIAYSPYEGPRWRFIGTNGTVEMEYYTSGKRAYTNAGTTFLDEVSAKGEEKKNGIAIRVSPADKEEYFVYTSFGEGAHGGSDDRMRDDIFRAPAENDPLHHFATSVEAYHSLAIGDMAVMSNRLGREVKLEELPE